MVAQISVPPPGEIGDSFYDSSAVCCSVAVLFDRWLLLLSYVTIRGKRRAGAVR
jgi:hypothetical protein